MKKFILLSVIVCSFCITGICQKNDGPVLKKELIGKYEGGLKGGLAQGKGTAIGRESYTGTFKKGLPNGEGVYTDSLGNIYKGSFEDGKKEGKGELTLKGAVKDSIQRGYWEKDKYVGSTTEPQYEISNKTGSVNPRIVKAGDGNKVEISIIDPISNGYISANISYKGQANLRTNFGLYYYDNATFPLEFDIQYECTNKMGTSKTYNSLHLKINKPGNWVVSLRN